jgi:hypothetical protein
MPNKLLSIALGAYFVSAFCYLFASQKLKQINSVELIFEKMEN